MKSPRITIIGFGNVGKALFYQFSELGFKIDSIFNRSGFDTEIQDQFKKVNFSPHLPTSSDNIGTHLFMTVSDDALVSVTENLVKEISDFNGKMGFHCSGTHASNVLQPIKEAGAKIGSFHPMKAITPKTNTFENTWFDIEGDEEAVQFLSELAENMGANAFKIKPESKPYLHAAAVVASNYLVVLADIVSGIMAEGEIAEHEALQSIIPLMKNTLQNIEETGPEKALTGPIERGDVNTVKQHIQILQKRPDLISLYKVLGLEAVRITKNKNGDSATLKEIKNLLI